MATEATVLSDDSEVDASDGESVWEELTPQPQEGCLQWSKEGSSSVRKRVEWLSSLLSKPTVESSPAAAVPKRCSDLVAQRRRLLQDALRMQRAEEEKSLLHIPISSDLAAKRTRLPDEKPITVQKPEAEQRSLTFQGSPSLLDDILILLKGKQQNEKELQRPSPQVNVSCDLVADRMRRLEESQKKMKREVTNQKSSFAKVSSELVKERRRWLLEKQMQMKGEGLPKESSSLSPSSSTEASSALVSEKRRMLEETQKQQPKIQQKSTIFAVPQALVAKRSQSYLLGHSKSSQNSIERQDSGKLDPTSMAAGGGRLAEKRVRFLTAGENQVIDAPRSRPGRSQRWGENYMPFVEQMSSNLMIELEQEGLLPDFLADHTTWLFGGHEKVNREAEFNSRPNGLDRLRLDYCQPESNQKTDVCNQSKDPPRMSLDLDNTGGVQGDSNCSQGNTTLLGVTSEGSERQYATAASLAHETVAIADGVQHDDPDVFLESVNGMVATGSELTAEECNALATAVTRSFCEIS